MGDLSQLASRLTLSSIIDILLVALLFYGLFWLMQGTRAAALLRGILLLILVTVLASSLLKLTAFTWLIKNSIPAFLVAIPVVFQPELRRALERLGRPGAFISAKNAQRSPRWWIEAGWLRGLFGDRNATTVTRMLQTVSRAAGELSDEKTGGLIVLEQTTGLQEFVDTGIYLDADVSVDLLLTIFFRNTPLHDGAVIIRDGRVVAASCTLPLSEDMSADHNLGTRHRAAVGVTEGTDAIAIVVSEQSGAISLAHNGRLTRYLEERELFLLLQSLYMGRSEGLPGELSEILTPHFPEPPVITPRAQHEVKE